MIQSYWILSVPLHISDHNVSRSDILWGLVTYHNDFFLKVFYFQSCFSSEQNGEEGMKISHTCPIPVPLLHHQHPPRWHTCYTDDPTWTRCQHLSPQLTPEVTAVHPVGLDKCPRTSIHHHSVTLSSLTTRTSSVLCLVILPPSFNFFYSELKNHKEVDFFLPRIWTTAVINSCCFTDSLTGSVRKCLLSSPSEPLLHLFWRVSLYFWLCCTPQVLCACSQVSLAGQHLLGIKLVH